MKRFMIFVLAVTVGSVSISLAGDSDGGYAGSYLEVPIGARPAAMGGTYIAISDDAAGVLYNPSGLSGLQKSVFGTSYRALGLDRTLGYATVIFPVRGQSALGIHWLYAGSGSVEARDSDGYTLGRDFYQNSHDFSVVFAKRFERWLSIGTKINYYTSSIPEVSAFSVGFDFGATIYIDQLYRRDLRENLKLKDTRIGVTVKYLGITYPWVSDKYETRYSSEGTGFSQDDDVPVEIGLGVSTRLMESKLLVAMDAIKNTKQGPEFHVGSEYQLNPQFALRAGWGDGRLAAGTGYQFNMGKNPLRIDYAFSTAKAGEGSEHIFSFDLSF